MASENGASFELRSSELELDKAIENLRGIVETGRIEPHETISFAQSSDQKAFMEIPVELHAVFGTAQMSVGHLSALTAGSTIELESRVGDPIDIMVNGLKIARGEMILLDDSRDRFGFRITEILR
ncbi:MAG: FliM/FliN family flagellar motor switch protein [Rhizobiaceae bacterium]